MNALGTTKNNDMETKKIVKHNSGMIELNNFTPSCSNKIQIKNFKKL